MRPGTYREALIMAVNKGALEYRAIIEILYFLEGTELLADFVNEKKLSRCKG